MAGTFRYLEVVVVTPQDGARDELLDARAALLSEYRAHFGDRFDATLSEAEDGDWVDVWRWVSRDEAEHALAHRELIPSFSRWERLVELRSLTWSRIID